MSDEENRVTIVPIDQLLIKYPKGNSIRQGWSPQCENYPATVGKWGVLKTTAIQTDGFRGYENKQLPDKLNAKEHLTVESGDILVTCAGPRSRCGIPCYVENAPPKLMISGKMYQLRVDQNLILPKYLTYFLQAPGTQSFIDSIKSGSNDSGLNLTISTFKKIRVPTPSIRAQAEIINQIEQSFEVINHGLRELFSAENKLELYRQSVLKDAFEGKLTADWRASNPDLVEPADKLLARIEAERKAAHQAELDAWKDAVSQWQANGKDGKKPTKPKFFQFDEEVIKSSSTMLSVKLGLTISEPKYGTSKKCSYESGQVPVLRIPNLGRGKINSQDLKYADFSRDELDNYKLESGDLLIIRSNGSVSLVGKTCVISEQEEGFLFAGYLIRIKPIQSIICSEYLRHTLGSLALRKQIVEKAKSTSGVNNLNAKEIQDLTINLVSLKEQQRLVEILSESEARYHDQLSTLNELKLKAEALKQSILKQAFSGHELLEDAS